MDPLPFQTPNLRARPLPARIRRRTAQVLRVAIQHGQRRRQGLGLRTEDGVDEERGADEVVGACGS
jgi:hypothetical protein